jgi:2-oxoglutarate dehydrogenase E1 component
VKPTRFDSYNAAYVQALFDQYLQNPSGVDENWRAFFENGGAAGLLGATVIQTTVAAGLPTTAQLRAARAFGELIDAYRLHGHQAAQLDPLGSEPHGHPMLVPEFHGATEDEIAAVPAEFMDMTQYGATPHDVLDFMRDTYTGTIGYEYEYLEDPNAREWLRQQIESNAQQQPLSAEEKRRLLARLTEVEPSSSSFTSPTWCKAFFHRGQRHDGADARSRHRARRAAGAREVVIGMAHRGRLNVLAHVLVCRTRASSQSSRASTRTKAAPAT